jgi:hypothetical protein
MIAELRGARRGAPWRDAPLGLVMASVRVRAMLCSEPAAPSRRRRVIGLRSHHALRTYRLETFINSLASNARSAPQVCGG